MGHFKTFITTLEFHAQLNKSSGTFFCSLHDHFSMYISCSSLLSTVSTKMQQALRRLDQNPRSENSELDYGPFRRFSLSKSNPISSICKLDTQQHVHRTEGQRGSVTHIRAPGCLEQEMQFTCFK